MASNTTCSAWRITAPGNITADLELVAIPRPTADHLDKNSLLIHVAGKFGIQIARALGCSLTVTCSTEKVRLCTHLGADNVIDYKREDVLKALQKKGHVFAHVVDAIGGSPPELYTLCDEIMVPGKKRHFASVGGGINAASAVNMYSGSMCPFWLGGSKTKWTPIIATNSHKDLAQIAVWMGEGKVKPAIDSTYSFEQVPEAFERHKNGSVAGKILINVVEGSGEALPSKEVN